MNTSTEIIGLFAATLTTSSFLPQVHQVWKTKSTESLSKSMLYFSIAGSSLWFIYGLLMNSFAIMASSSITLLLQLCLIYFKYSFETSDKSITTKIPGQLRGYFKH